MSKVVRIPETIYQRLQKLAVPLEDTPASVIEKLLDFHELQSDPQTLKEEPLPAHPQSPTNG